MYACRNVVLLRFVYTPGTTSSKLKDREKQNVSKSMLSPNIYYDLVSRLAHYTGNKERKKRIQNENI